MDEVELLPVNGSLLIDVSPDGHAAVVWIQQGANGYELWSIITRRKSCLMPTGIAGIQSTLMRVGIWRIK